MFPIYCLVGPSGVGKDTIRRSLSIPSIISFRTRPIRTGEVNGEDGWFITKEEFLEMDEQHEWLAKTLYDGHYYGVSFDILDALITAPISYVVDWPAIEVLKANLSTLDPAHQPEIVTIFIDAPVQSLVDRMQKQGNRPQSQILSRINRLPDDHETREKCDYVVQNQDGLMEKCIAEIEAIIKKTSPQK
jgi:guanylate kinase